MLIPIDNSVDVPLISAKEASTALNRYIKQSCSDDSYDRVISVLASELLPLYATDPELAKEQTNRTLDQFERSLIPLRSNNYTYLTTDVCDMIRDTQDSLKSWDISDLPIVVNSAGVILFEKAKFQTGITMSDYDPSDLSYVNVTGILWSYQDTHVVDIENDEHTEAPVLWVSLITDLPSEYGPTGLSTVYSAGNNEYAYQIHENSIFRPIWTPAEKGPIDEAIVDYFAATMMLMQQREIIAAPATYAPTVKRGKRRDPVLVPTGEDGEKTPFRISTISLSETVRKAYAANSSSTGQKPTKSWWVKGHWRRQAHGPNHSLRKLIYIHPHISGNVNAPLDDRKTMTKIVP